MPLARRLDLTAAWQRVARRGGLPGVDGIDVGRFEVVRARELAQLQHELEHGTYCSLPLRAAVLRSPGRPPRSLVVPSVRDRICRGAMAEWLGRQFDTAFDSHSFAFRRGRGVHDALRAVQALRDEGYVHLLHADVQACFESVPHPHLLAAVSDLTGRDTTVLGWVTAVLATPVWDGLTLTTPDEGLAQGCPLSPWLSNALLDTVDRQLRQAGYRFVRYADDILVMARSAGGAASAAMLLRAVLDTIGLTPNPTKTRITSFEKGFAYLGTKVQGDQVWMPFGSSSPARGMLWPASEMPRPLLRAYRLAALERWEMM